MIGTPNYQPAKFLDSIIKNYIPDSYMLHSTDHFLDEITSNLKLITNLLALTLNLFTNVPLDETI